MSPPPSPICPHCQKTIMSVSHSAPHRPPETASPGSNFPRRALHMLRSFALLAVSALALAACNDQASTGGGARDQIRAVGSSNVCPFTQLVAEQFVNKNPGMKEQVIESTGTRSEERPVGKECVSKG